jgi:GntR family transcriptional regulator
MLAQKLGVSRATLREAMRTFETQGLIHRQQGAGTFVLRPTEVIESGLEVLESIETIARRKGLQVTMGKLSLELHPASEEEAAALGIPADNMVLIVSRVILAERRPVAYLVDILPQDVLKPEEIQSSFGGSVLDLLLNRGTPKLSSSRTEINAVNAPPEVARLLGIRRGNVLLRFVAYLFSTQGSVVDYSLSYFLPGYFRFHVVRRVAS